MASEREQMRNALLSGLEPSGELGKRFKTQVDSILHRRLPTHMRVIGAVQSVVFTAAGVGMAYASISNAIAGKAQSSARGTFEVALFGVTAALFLAFALFVGRQAASGYQAPRRWNRRMINGVAALAMSFSIVYPMIAPNLNLSSTGTIWGVYFALYSWVFAWSLYILSSEQWHHDDAMLEQKRTQLEIALLRERLGANVTDKT